MVLALPAHILCRQSGVVYKLIAEGIWLETELSTLHSVLRERRVGCRAGQWGAIHCGGGGEVSLLPPNTHPRQIAKAQCDRQAKNHLGETQGYLMVRARKSLFLSKFLSSR